MSMYGIGYIDHGVGMLDPERYREREIKCVRCREYAYESSMSEDYSEPICPECDEAIKSIALKVKYAQHYEHIVEFFDWVLNEAIPFTPDIVNALFNEYIESGTVDYEEWAISGKGRNL